MLRIFGFGLRNSQELGPLKSTLAKQWGARKAEYTKRVAKNTGALPHWRHHFVNMLLTLDSTVIGGACEGSASSWFFMRIPRPEDV